VFASPRPVRTEISRLKNVVAPTGSITPPIRKKISTLDLRVIRRYAYGRYDRIKI